MIKVGIIGAGSIGTSHANCISKIDSASITAIADIDIKKSETLAGNFDAQVLSPDELINSKNVDVVYVCVPSSAHSIYVIKSAKAGKNVFVEKPLARTLKEGKEMLEAVKKAKVKFTVGHILRFFPEYIKVRDILKTGTIGKPAIARTTRAGSSPGSWYLDIEHGAGVVLDFIIHDIDFLRWCFGDAKRVYAKGLIYKKLSNMDYALVTIRFKNGVIAHIEGSWAHKSWRTRLEIAGDKGLINLDSSESISLKMEIIEDDKIIKTKEIPVVDSPLFLEDKHFLECISLNKEPVVSGIDAYKSLEISLAALDSIKEDRVVNL